MIRRRRAADGGVLVAKQAGGGARLRPPHPGRRYRGDRWREEEPVLALSAATRIYLYRPPV
jgi:hypothetical protein